MIVFLLTNFSLQTMAYIALYRVYFKTVDKTKEPLRTVKNALERFKKASLKILTGQLTWSRDKNGQKIV